METLDSATNGGAGSDDRTALHPSLPCMSCKHHRYKLAKANIVEESRTPTAVFKVIDW